MAAFIRRFLSDPGPDVLLEIESVNVLDLEPPASIRGIGTGNVMMVGEFENGPFATPTEVGGVTEYVNTFGTLGYAYGGVQGNNPSARSRNADGALVAETWNGNAFVQLSGKKYARLVLTRVDTSVGSVNFYRQAYVTGGAAFAYNLEPSEVLSLDIGGSAPVSATFTATAATYNSGSGTYPTSFVGGETLVLGYDDVTNFTVTFLPSDTTHAQIVARINATAGFTFASVQASSVTRLVSRQRGNAAQVRVISGSSGVLTALGMTAGTTLGTGNVGNIDAVQFREIKSVVETAVSGAVVSQDLQGNLRVSKTYVGATDYIAIGSATTATGLGFTVGDMNSNDGVARLLSGVGTYATSFAGGETVTFGIDGDTNFTVTFTSGDQTRAQVITAINAAAGFTFVEAGVASTRLLFSGVANGGQVRIVSASAPAVLTTLGLALGTTTCDAALAGVIPAGTQVQNAANTRSFVTMQDLAVTATSSDVGEVKVRHATDDGTGLSAAAGTIVLLTRSIELGSFSVINELNLTAALSEAAIDAQYALALDATLNLNSIAREVNVVISARQSNVVRRKLRTNVIDASAQGMFGRMACLRSPMGVAIATATSNVAEPGVGAYRDRRVIYSWPQVRTFVPIIGLRGTAGGTGFTATGNVDVGADALMASILSQLNPEENPGQETAFTSNMIGLESSSNADNLGIEQYKRLKAAGIAAPRVDNGIVVFQSGITSVDPGSHPNLVNIARQRMADFIEDSLARRFTAFSKKLNTEQRRNAVTSEMTAFMEGLLSRNDPTFQRIAGYTIDDKSANTPALLARGLFRIRLVVKNLSSLDSIVLESTVGETVEVEQVIPAAA